MTVLRPFSNKNGLKMLQRVKINATNVQTRTLITLGSQLCFGAKSGKRSRSCLKKKDQSYESFCFQRRTYVKLKSYRINKQPRAKNMEQDFF